MSKDRIAVIGVGCRFPGGVSDVESFWKLLVDGREAVGEVPADRWNVERFFDAEPGIAGKSIARRGGFIDGIDLFDPQFFGISPREAPYVDPQHRLLLETAYEAIEDAGVVLDLEKGTDIAVYVGISHMDYHSIQSTPWEHNGITPHSPTGCAHSIAANRISYCFNLRGPSLAMDTACSSALTAVHAACEHIWAGRGDTALAGGVTVMIAPGGFIGFSQASMLSPEGRCKAFDASADGFVRGEGAGMVLLKRLSEALADGDPIQGIILGTALNQDGHTNGISLPSTEAQARLVREACADAGVAPEAIGYVEAHGTGTAVGDPIEAHALAEGLCADRSPDAPLPIGSVKTNLGHLETAAGVAGLLKAMLVLKHGQIPASLHFDTPNPHIDFSALKLRVPVALEPFPATSGERLVGVNSFGFGGSNAHVIMAEPPARVHVEQGTAHRERPWPVVISARSEEALRGAALRLAAWLGERAHANGSTPVLPDLTYTLGARRNHHPFRLTAVSGSLAELAGELDAFATGQETVEVRTSFSPRREHAPRVAFVMSGQGPQWWGMGRELMAQEPAFRAAMERCAAAMQPWATWSLLEELGRSEETSRLARTEIAQPAIFAMQVALAELWASWGVVPAAIVGHSVGEIAAACVAGILPLADAARTIVLRARAMEECARGEGTMLAIGLGEEEARALIARHDRTVTIAAYNGPRSLTLAGRRISLELMAAELEPQGVFARLVKVDHPFHNPLMEPAALALETALAELSPEPETIPFFSTVTGDRCEGLSCDATHWGNGIRQPVRFAAAVGAVADFGVDVWLELSAHPALVHSVQECLAGRSGPKPVVIASTRREREHRSLLLSAMDLHLAGVELLFRAITPSRRLLSLPAYAWDKARWWHESSDSREGRLAPGGRGLLDVRLPRAQPTWIARLDARHMAFLQDHKVDSHVIFPAAAFIEMALEAGVQLFEGRPFVIEDFEIRKPLILPDPASGVHLELSYSAADRTFTIQSRFDQSPAWGLHVVGSLRGERTDAAFASSRWDGAHTDLLPIDPVAFYQVRSDLGLRYGAEFRPVRELAAGGGHSSGRVSLSPAISARAGEYAVHPVLFDGALHVFSAAAGSVEETQGRMKLPVRFARILFLRSPGAASRVRAAVQAFNDDFTEGGFGLYDDAGLPCVRVDGFRAIAISGARRGGSDGSRGDVTYHVGWERTPGVLAAAPPAPLPLAQLHLAAQGALNVVLALRGRDKLQQAMAAVDDLAAALVARGFREMGVVAGQAFTAVSLGVTTAMRPAWERLVLSLCERSLVVAEGAGFRAVTAFGTVANSAEETLRQFVSDHPGHLPEALLCAGNCAELGPILRGEKDAVQVLFAGAGADLLDEFYGDGLLTSPWLAAIAAAVQAVAANLPEGRGLRILEIGAGTGGLASHVLPLLERGLHSYTFSDVSAGFFSPAMQKLAAHPEVETKVFDLEKPGTEQGFDAASFDLVIGTNVLHAVSDVRAALENLHTLMAPGASLIFMDTASERVWTRSVFGLTSGWWRFTDRDLRPEHPLLDRAQWEAVLRRSGFSDASSLPGLVALNGGESQIGMLARKAWQSMPAPAIEPALSPGGGEWLVLADAGGVGDSLAAALRADGAHCRTIRAGTGWMEEGDAVTLDPASAEDWRRLLGTAAPDRIVYLWALDAPATLATADPLLSTEPLLQLAQAIAVVHPAARLRLDFITRAAQPAGRGIHPVAFEQGAAMGLLRVIFNEYSNIVCRGIDLPPEPSLRDEALIRAELASADAEREIAFRGEARYVQRLNRGRATSEVLLPAGTPLRLESRDRGHLDALRFAPFNLPACAAGQVEIDVKAAGMNFRDVLKALGLYPGEAPDARIFGDEVGGIVTAVGEGVDHVAVGDRVFGLAIFGLATRTLARAADIRRIPAGLSFEQAATLPVVFMTSWHALKNVARIRKGERVLIHAGAGGVGMAAVQIALHLGAEVIASAGNAIKRSLLQTLGVQHVIDSRRADFADAVMEITAGRGVDIVLNALAAEAIPMGLACLAEGGRFLEIGKRDIYQNTRIPLWPLRRNASFHVIAMDAVFSGDEALTRDLLAELAGLVEQGALRPLPYRAFPASRIDAAFRLMAGGKHIGKVVVAFPEPFVSRRGEPLAPGFRIRPDGCYLITGAWGGFGKVLAQWLADGGARHLVLTSRSGPTSPEALALLQSLQARGVSVRSVLADAGSPEDVCRLLGEIEAGGQPLRGVFHLAMAIDDAPIAALNRDRMQTVLAPKACGAWLLHEGTRGIPLDCFVMFSSVSSIFGNPAQGNYSAANAFLDSLAHHRHAIGLPALAVNWGVLGGEGYVARNERVGEFLARQGTSELSTGEVTGLLQGFLAAGAPQAMAIRVDWAKWRGFFRGLQENPLVEHIYASVEGEETSTGAGDWRRRLDGAAPAEREGIVVQAVRDVVGSVLRVKPESLREDQPLTDLGLDSLMGVEIETSLEAALGVALPPTSLMRARTIGQIAALITVHLGGSAPVVAAPALAEPEPSFEVDLEALSDEEIDGLLGESAREPEEAAR